MKQKSIKLFIIILVIVSLTFFTYPRIKRFFQIDSCLDSGGRWNYETGQCEFMTPENSIITEIIIETIKQDSLDISHPIISKLVNYYFYKIDIPKDYDLKFPPPPPPPPSNEKGVPLTLQYFRPNQEKTISYTITLADSLYFERQMNNAKNVELDSMRLKDIIPFIDITRSKVRSREFYEFVIPLFNYDNSIAWVQYNFRCPTCGYGRMVVFKKTNNVWLKINSYPTWMN
jgi:hypothetical protein